MSQLSRILLLLLLTLKITASDIDSDYIDIIGKEWKNIYSQLLDFEDKHHAFITDPTMDKIIEQFRSFVGKNLLNYPLAGMPIAVKDNIMTSHQLYPTTSGSVAFKDFIAPQNAEIVQSLISLGAIIYGKTNLHEFALGITTCNKGYGCCTNPINQTRNPGGSSGGTAAAIGAQYVTFGLGTDTGGSVRIPAASTNIIGFLPTQHRYPIDGVFPLTNTADTVGLMGNNIDEICMVDYALIYRDKKKHCNNLKDYTDQVKIGVLDGYFQYEMDPNIAKSFQKTLDLLNEGQILITIETDNAEFEYQRFKEKYATLPTKIISHEWPREASHYLNVYKANITLRELWGNSKHDAKDWMNAMLDPTSSSYINVQQYHSLQLELLELKKLFNDYFVTNDIDLIVYPTLTCEPPLITEEITMTLNGKQYNTREKILQNTKITALTGLPCITIPGIKVEDSQFAVGFEMCAKQKNDEFLLAVAKVVVTAVNQYQNDDKIKQEL